MLTTLLITNITITVSVGIMVLKEIDKLKRDVEHTELSVTVQTRKDAEKLGYDIADMKKELKEQISKEFITIPYRHIR
ncbi:hypothetical protein K144313037_p20490 (plasmid) [Clostridium tetani]|uniref:hypothetical protein n=1 Tax=Clostridium tetani TaxID=1513 RepID=UPI0029529D4D|nr:hypothetical protein [Clostridium tetani]BDR71262.1 hypothetical protein K144313037_p20490 [Clostridium tetani]BEV19063.1 hypothetical protein K154301001_09180 [Clostridium tetani]